MDARFWWWIPILTLLNPYLIAPTNTAYVDKRTSAFSNGDFIIGALFPLHEQPPTKKKFSGEMKCGKIREHYGIQRAEVALQTIDKINRNRNLLPNLTLGIEIRDECWYAPIALQQSIELIRDAITPVSPTFSDTCFPLERKRKRGPLIGVVGPGSSSVALQVQNLLQLFHLPQVGYSTTSRDLSDKSRFNYFLRVVPSDYFQAQVMLDIVRYHGWTYVSAVNTDENYGQSGIQAFRELAEKADVCIAREDSVLSSADDEVFDKVVKNLKQDTLAVVVVCFCEGFTVRKLLQAALRLNVSNHFSFIGSDGWADRGDVTKDLESEAWGSISIRIHSPHVKDFDPYYLSLRPETNKRNPWFEEFWETVFNCSLRKTGDKGDGLNYTAVTDAHNETRLCTGKEQLSIDKQDAKLSFVIKAIYTLAHGLHNMQQSICGQGFGGMCDKLLPFNGSLFKNYLTNVSFEFEGDVIEFDEHGDPPGRYDIMNFQRHPNGTYDYIQVGEWNNGTLKWNQELQLGPNTTHVQSVCAEECPKGHYKKTQPGGKDKRCCWACVRCPHGSILDKSSNNQNCVKCRKGSTPDREQMVCVELPIEHTQWSDAQAIVAMAFASMGFLTTIFACVVFLKHNNTPVVKSSTKELSYIILVGMSFSHASIFAILAKPTRLTCGLSRLMPGVSFAVIYSAVLTKTNRIARILAGSKKKFPTRKPLFMSAAAQVVITCFLIGIEVGISCGFLYYEKPNTTLVYFDKKTVLECDTTPSGIVAPLAFDFLLILLCTLYALKTRNVPENFNEAKFIGFSMYTTCVIWIAFVPIYFGSDSKVITMCMCVTLSALVIWLFLFVPKLYIILLKPERNNRTLFTTSKTIRCHIGSRVASAISEKSSTNSWRETSTSGFEAPEKRTLSVQTGNELLQVLLNPRGLMEVRPCSPTRHRVPRITERDCCEADNCEVKKITIKLPDHQQFG